MRIYNRIFKWDSSIKILAEERILYMFYSKQTTMQKFQSGYMSLDPLSTLKIKNKLGEKHVKITLNLAVLWSRSESQEREISVRTVKKV